LNLGESSPLLSGYDPESDIRDSWDQLRRAWDLSQMLGDASSVSALLDSLFPVFSRAIQLRAIALFLDEGAGYRKPSFAQSGNGIVLADMEKAWTDHLEEGVAEWAVSQGRACCIPTLDENSEGAFALIPLRASSGLRGFFWLATDWSPSDLTGFTLPLLEILGSQASLALASGLQKQKLENRIYALDAASALEALRDSMNNDLTKTKEPPIPWGRRYRYWSELPAVLRKKLDFPHLWVGIRAEGAWNWYPEPPPTLPPLSLPPTSVWEAKVMAGLGRKSEGGPLSLRDDSPDWVRIHSEPPSETHYHWKALDLGQDSQAHALLFFALPDENALGRESNFSRNDLTALLANLAIQARAIGDNMGLVESLEKANQSLTTLQWQLAHSGKMAALGQLAGGVAHEINNPLQILLARLQLAQQAEDVVSVRKELDLLQSEILRIRSIVNNLLDFARQGKAQWQQEPVRLRSLLEECLELMAHSLTKAKIELVWESGQDTAMALGDKGRLKQVALNLLLNAVQAMELSTPSSLQERDTGKILPPAKLTLNVWVDEEEVGFSVADTGPGIPNESLEKIFDPFFTTKDHGTGLGLSITYSLVREHQGHLEVESKVGSGSRFTIRLPRHRSETALDSQWVG
jgi:signal transduction histidine kinase